MTAVPAQTRTPVKQTQAACKHVLNAYRPLVLNYLHSAMCFYQILRMRVLLSCLVTACLRFTNE